MARELNGKAGFVRVGVLALVLALGAVAATVIVARNQTDFLNQAAGKQSWQGEVEKVSPCVNGNLCFQLVKTDNGKKHYLLAVKAIPFEMPALCINSSDKNKCKPRKGLNLANYVGKGPVEIFGKIIDTSKPKYIYVTSVSKGLSSKEQLSITEIGTVVQEVVPIPVPDSSDPGTPVSSNGRGQSVSNRGYALSGTTGNGGSSEPSNGVHYLSPNYGGHASDPGLMPEPVPGCITRPSCLDAKPACRIMMPEGGWCPPTKKCTPRPSCLDQGCEIGPAPGTQFCPPTPKSKTQYSLLTTDGRKYSLVSKTGSPCPKGAYCAELMAPEINFAQYVGKTVFVEGVMVMKVPNQKDDLPCPAIYPPPPGCGGGKTSWWPLPTGLRFEVKKIQEASEIVTKTTLKDFVGNVKGDYSDENMLVFSYLKPCSPETFPCPAGTNSDSIYLRSSIEDISKYANKHINAVGGIYLLNGSKSVVMNLGYAGEDCVSGLQSYKGVDSCGGENYRRVEYVCGDGGQSVEGGDTSCKSLADWKAIVFQNCQGKSSCPAQSHSTCNNNACVKVSGDGNNECETSLGCRAN